MIDTTRIDLGTTIRLAGDIDSTVTRVTQALQAEGYGVLTEIDVKATLKKKINVDFRPYKILGACNPALAHRALMVSPEVGLLLPCNVTVSQVAEGTTEVALIDPLVMLGVVSNPDLQPIAAEARARLDRVAAALRA